MCTDPKLESNPPQNKSCQGWMPLFLMPNRWFSKLEDHQPLPQKRPLRRLATMDGNSSRLKSRFLEGIPSQAKPNGIRRKNKSGKMDGGKMDGFTGSQNHTRKDTGDFKTEKESGAHAHPQAPPPSNCFSMCIHLFAFAPDLTLVCLMVWVGLVMWCALSPIHPPLAS